MRLVEVQEVLAYLTGGPSALRGGNFGFFC